MGVHDSGSGDGGDDDTIVVAIMGSNNDNNVDGGNSSDSDCGSDIDKNLNDDSSWGESCANNYQIVR